MDPIKIKNKKLNQLLLSMNKYQNFKDEKIYRMIPQKLDSDQTLSEFTAANYNESYNSLLTATVVTLTPTFSGED